MTQRDPLAGFRRERHSGFVLDDDQVVALRVVVIDPESDAELYRSPAEIPVQLGVA